MTKGAYTVRDDPESRTNNTGKDNSFSSFICALLIFLAICLIIFLAAFNWKSVSNSEESVKVAAPHKNQEVEDFSNTRNGTTKKSEKIMLIEVPATTVIPRTTTSRIIKKLSTASTSKSTVHETTIQPSTATSKIIKRLTTTTILSPTVYETTKRPSTVAITRSPDQEEVTLPFISTDRMNETTSATTLSGMSTKPIVENNLTNIPLVFNNVTENDDTEESTTDNMVSFDINEYESDTPTTTHRQFISTKKIVVETSTADFSSDSTESSEIVTVLTNTSTALLTPSTTSTPRQLITSTTEKASSAFPKSTFTASILFKKTPEPLCRSSVCNIAASRMLSLMNHSSSPCEDFYEFACGGAAHVHVESADSSHADMLSTQLNTVHNLSPKYLKDFKNFYRGCLEHEDYFKYHERIQGVKELLDEVGQFQEEGSSASYDLTDLFSKLILRQSIPLFDIGLDVDKQSSNFILQLTLPQESSLKLGLKTWSGLSLLKEQCLKKQLEKIDDSYINLNTIYMSYTNCQGDYTSYLNSIENVVRELGIFSNLTSDKLLKEIKDIRFSVEFDVLNQFMLLPKSPEIRNVYVKKEYDVRKVSDLQAQYPILEWKKLLKTLTGHDVQDNNVVQVYFGQYFTGIFTAFASVDKRKLHNAFLAILANDLFLNTVVTKELSKREEFCMDLSKTLMPDVWASLVESIYSPGARSYQENMITQLFDILKNKKFCKSLISTEWISSNDTTSFKKKCDNIYLGLFSGVPKSVLEDNYKNLALTGNYSQDLVQLLTHSRQMMYSLEGSSIDTTKIFSYFLDPLDRKPVSFYTNGMIAVPLGLMERASEGLPGYLVMARVGFQLAKEIARHFDPTGMKYDVKLTGTSKTTYNELVTNTDLNSTRYMLFKNHNVSFDAYLPLSTNEKIRENAAFRLVIDSFNAYGSEQLLPWISGSYSREKIFFLAAAQEYCKKTSLLDFMVKVLEDSHLPPTLSVENLMSNSDVFSEKFSCAPGSGMNLNEVKYQFPYLEAVSDDYSYDN